MLTRLLLKFSHLNRHKFCRNLKYCLSPMCDCGAETETISHFFLRSQFFANERQKLHDNVYRIDASVKNLNEEFLIDVLLDGSDRYNDSKILKYKYFSIKSAIFNLANVLKDFLLTSANFFQLLPLCSSLICLLKLYLQCNLLSLYFNLFTDF